MQIELETLSSPTTQKHSSRLGMIENVMVWWYGKVPLDTSHCAY